MALRIERTFAMSLPEVSGLGWRRAAGGGARQLVILGDRTFQVGVADWGGGKLSFELHDLGPLCQKEGQRDSQWEAIAGDGSGALFVLEESPGAVFVFSPGLDRRLCTIHLEVPGSSPYRADWDRDENSRGEGLVLLRSGHLLVLKEKKPSMLLEFGPAGEAPRGYARGEAVAGDAVFPMPAGDEVAFVPLAAWRLPRADQAIVGDLSDLTVDRRGRLFALSDQNGLLVRLESNLRTDEASCSVKRTWALPAAIDKPEGLVITDDDQPIVARDTTARGGNGFVLEAVDLD